MWSESICLTTVIWSKSICIAIPSCDLNLLPLARIYHHMKEIYWLEYTVMWSESIRITIPSCDLNLQYLPESGHSQHGARGAIAPTPVKVIAPPPVRKICLLHCVLFTRLMSRRIINPKHILSLHYLQLKYLTAQSMAKVKWKIANTVHWIVL